VHLRSLIVNKHEHAEIDLGTIIFTDTTTMTADGGFQFLLYMISGNSGNTDVEAEPGENSSLPLQKSNTSLIHGHWSEPV